MPNVTINLTREWVGRVAVGAYKRAIKARARDLRPAWDAVLMAIHWHEAVLFANEGANTEEARWEELSNNPHPARQNLGYRDWKARHYPNRGILELTERLRRQLSGTDNTAFVRRGVRKLIFGSNIPLAGGHDLGGLHATGRLGMATIGGGGGNYMPPRSPIRVDRPYEDEIGDAVLDYLLDAR